MALARCEECGKPKGVTRKYIRNVEPLGYPNDALICGKKGCVNPALIWLEAYEWREYQSGQTIFEPPSTSSAKFKVKLKS